MKKIFLAICCGAMMLTSACGSKASANYTAEQTATGDSIVDLYAQMVAYQTLQRYQNMPDSLKKNFSKDDYIKGIATVLQADTANAQFMEGIQMGMNLYGLVSQAPDQLGMPIDAQRLIKAIQENMKADSVSDEQMAQLQSEFMLMNGRMQQLAQEKEMAAVKNSEAYKKNTADGEEYAKAQIANGFKKSDSGLVYNIENEGEGEKVKASDRVKVIYKGTLTDGTVFDESKDGVVFTPTQVVPGFGEILQMLGKGGKAVAVIPGNLAYGDMGRGGLIGPNQTLVFEIEIAEVNPEK